MEYRSKNFRIAKSECSQILEKVAKRFKISLKEVVIYYSLPTSTGEEKEMQLVYVDEKESNLENQELFYSLAPETQLITVEEGYRRNYFGHDLRFF